MSRRGQKLGRLVVGGIVLSALLTSCFMADPEGATNPSSISRDGDSLVVAVCTDARVTNVRVEGRKNSDRWQELYVANGVTNMSSGDTFTTDGSVPGLTASVSIAPDLDQLTRYAIQMTDMDAETTVSDANFDVPAAGIPEGKWLHWDGTITDDPCST